MAPSTSEPLLLRVRSSCEKLLAHEDAAVRVVDAGIARFLESLDDAKFASLAGPDRFPLNFRSPQEEIGFLTLYSLLNFGSGYRKDLHKYCDRGAADTILYGLLGMYISVPALSADYLKGMSLDVVANFFAIPLERDEELSTGIYIARPGPLKPLVQMIQHALNECGQKLAEQGYADFGAFVIANLHGATSEQPSAVHLVEQLVCVFPAFDDHREVRGEKVFFLKRAQLAVASIHRRFKETNPEFAFADMEQLTVMSDNVLPCVLRALGILEYDPALAQIVDSGEHLPAGARECEIRAGAVVAAEKIRAASGGRFTVDDLDWYLWRAGKEPEYRGLERHATRDTFFY